MENVITKEEKTAISHSTTIVGNINAEEHLIINGTVKGNIQINKYNLIIGPAICQGSCRMNVNFFFSTLGPLHAAIWTTSLLLPFGGFNQT